MTILVGGIDGVVGVEVSDFEGEMTGDDDVGGAGVSGDMVEVYEVGGSSRYSADDVLGVGDSVIGNEVGRLMREIANIGM